MKKVVINLSPQRYKTPNLGLQNIVSYVPLLVIAAIAGLVVVLLLNIVVLKRAHTYSVKTKSWKVWEEKAEILQAVQQQISELKAKQDKLNQVLTPDYQMSAVLGDIFSSLPRNIWFRSLDFQAGVLNIQGYVVRWNQDYLTSLDSFIKALREKAYFASSFSVLAIKRSQKADFNKVEVLKFTIECKK